MVAIVFALGLAVSATPAAADCTIVPTLRVGSKGASVSCMQSIVGAKADGSFGPMTKASVMAYQASHGLTADGVVGPKTVAVMMGGAVSGNFPAGCTSASGFSMTTGVPCTSGPSTGIPAGCTSATTGFSVTTGKPCNGSTGSTGGTSTGPLTGGAGDVTITSGADTESSVTEGDGATKVDNFKVKAEGGDVQVDNVKVEFVNNDGGSSTRFSRYADTVTIYEGSTKVGSADVADFTKDGSTYSKSISLSGAVVRENAKNDFFVEVTPIAHIDGADDTNDWSVSITQVRFEDATGAILTGDVSDLDDQSFNFESLATSGDVKGKVSTTGPTVGDVVVSDTGTTSDVPLLKITVKAQGSAMTWDTLTVDLDTTGVDNDGQMISNLKLVEGTSASGNEIDSQSVSTTGGNDDQTITFTSSDDVTIAQDATKTYTVFGKIKQIDTDSGDDAVFDQGDSVSVTMSDPTDSGNFNLEDSNGDNVDVTGSATGETQTFKSQGVSVALDSAPTPTVDAKVSDVSTDDTGKFVLNFNVTANDETVFIPLSVHNDTDLANGVSFVIQNASTGATYTPGAGSTAGTVLEQVGSQSGVIFHAAGCGGADCLEISDGSTANFRLTAYEDPAATGTYRLQLVSVNFKADSAGAVDTQNNVTPVQNFRSGSIQIGN